MVSTRTADRVALAGCAVAIPLSVAGFVFDALTWSSGQATGNVNSDAALVPVFALAVFMGALIVRRRPGNVVGRLLCAFCCLASIVVLTDGYATYGVIASPGSVPGASAAAWLSNWIWTPAVATLLAIMPPVFPDGHVLTRRWRSAVLLAIVATSLLSVGQALQPGPLDDYPIDNPIGVESARGVVDALTGVGFVLFFLALWVSATAVVVRFRRTTGVERLQLKWLVSAAVLVAALFVLGVIVGWAAGADGIFNVVLPISVAAIVAATGIAVLRYRLFELDRLVNRTLVYGALSALLAGVYFGIVVAFQQVFSGFAGGSDLAIAVSTLAVAALFRPARRGIQSIVDRRFYRSHYDAQRTLETFSARLRDELDLETLRGELAAVVQQTMQPAHVSIWLRGAVSR
jgi:hypothetical protein